MHVLENVFVCSCPFRRRRSEFDKATLQNRQRFGVGELNSKTSTRKGFQMFDKGKNREYSAEPVCLNKAACLLPKTVDCPTHAARCNELFLKIMMLSQLCTSSATCAT